MAAWFILVERSLPDGCGLANITFGFLKLRPDDNLLDIGVFERCHGSAMLFVVLVFEHAEEVIVECEFSEFSREWPMYWEYEGVGSRGVVASRVEQRGPRAHCGLELFCIASSVDDRDLWKKLLILEGFLLGGRGIVSEAARLGAT